MRGGVGWEEVHTENGSTPSSCWGPWQAAGGAGGGGDCSQHLLSRPLETLAWGRAWEAACVLHSKTGSRSRCVFSERLSALPRDSHLP